MRCEQVRAEVARIESQIAALGRDAQTIRAKCAHDELREAQDYQDHKPYWTCLGCGVSLMHKHTAQAPQARPDPNFIPLHPFYGQRP